MPQVQRNFPETIPYGWYFVGYCDELQPGDVKSHHYFGRDVVLFRNEQGEAGMLDAHCPHLGAHIGHGGVVDGDSVRCPFHGWSFRPDGWCSKIPYAKKMPPITKRQAIIQSYPLRETNGVIWAWYHPRNAAPLFEVATYPEFSNPGWVKQIRREWRVAINAQEVAENAVDVAHFEFVHRSASVPDGGSSYQGHLRHSWTSSPREVVRANGEVERIMGGIRSDANGAGQKVTIIRGAVEIALMVLITPIEADDSEIRFAMTHPEVEPGSSLEADYGTAIENLVGQRGLEGDIPIWNNKVHRARPLLCDGDGDILRFRNWFSQFYADDDCAGQIAAE